MTLFILSEDLPFNIENALSAIFIELFQEFIMPDSYGARH